MKSKKIVSLAMASALVVTLLPLSSLRVYAADSGKIVADGGDTVTVEGNASNTWEPTIKVSGASNSVTVTGNVTSVKSEGVYIETGSTTNKNTVTVGGNVSGGSEGIYTYGISQQNTVIVGGNVSGDTGAGIYIKGSDNKYDQIRVTGNVSSSSSDGISNAGTGNGISVSQSVIGYNNGISNTGTGNVFFVTKDVTGSNADGIKNTGTGNIIMISGGVTGKEDGIYSAGSNNTIEVTGDASGDTGAAVHLAGTKTGDNISVKGCATSSQSDAIVDEGTGNAIKVNDPVIGYKSGIKNTGDSNVIIAADNVIGLTEDGIESEGNNSAIVVAGNIIGADDGIDSEGTNNQIQVYGDVKGTGTDEAGIDEEGSGNVIFVAGDVTGTSGTAVIEKTTSSTGFITILGTANGNIVIKADSSATSADAELANVGNIVVSEIKASGDMVKVSGNDTIASDLASKVGQQKIYYIIDTEKTSNGTITITQASNLVEVKDANGEVEKDANGNTLYAANLSQTVNVKIEAAAGYELQSASAGKASLTKNADGSFTLTIPAGGGVDLSAVFKAISNPGALTPDDFSAAIASAYMSQTLPKMSKVNTESVQLDSWEQVNSQLKSLNSSEFSTVSGEANDLLKMDIVNINDMTIPTSVIDSLKASTGIKKLHLFIGSDDAITIDGTKDLSNYQATNFTHVDTVTENSRIIDFTNKQAIGANVLFHTRINKANAKVKIYKMVDGQKKLLGTVNSNENGALCFEINETAQYVLEY